MTWLLTHHFNWSILTMFKEWEISSAFISMNFVVETDWRRLNCSIKFVSKMLSLTWCNIRFTLKRNVLKNCYIEEKNSRKKISWWLRIMIEDKKVKIVKRKEVNWINFRFFVVFYRRKYRRLREDSTCYFTTFVKCLVKKAFDRLFDQQNFSSFVSSKKFDLIWNFIFERSRITTSDKELKTYCNIMNRVWIDCNYWLIKRRQ